ncbi:MAG: T9SS type A sorting domain-containing protein [candidate division WOR-3 bacterium]|nr:MAG: T9SS type A sorting domain-containing protein [candidate division WOR-3 bacterium]
MKLFANICVALLILSTASYAQGPNIVWTKTFGTSGYEEIVSMRQTPDGGFIMAGHVDQGQDAKVYLVKTDCLGNIDWESIADSSGCEGRCVEIAVDDPSVGDGYVVVGQRFLAAGTRAFFMKFSVDDGDLDIYREYQHPNGEANYIQQITEDYYVDCYLVVGSFVNGSSVGDAWTFVARSNGQIYDEDTLYNPAPYNDRGLAGCEVWEPYPGYAITGKWSNPGDYNVFLHKLDPSLNEQWTVGFGGNHEDEGRSVKEVDDGIVVTGLYSDDSYPGRAWLVKRDFSGDSVWAKFIADAGYRFSEGFDLEVTNDGGFIVCGECRTDSDSASTSVYVVRTDDEGNILWYKEIGGEELDIGYSIEEIDDNTYIIAGVTLSYGAGSMDGYLIKLGDMINDTDDSLALAYNGNRHLVREPDTEKLHLVYTRGGEIVYHYSSDGGANWDEPETIGEGAFPAIVLDGSHLPSVAWTDDEGGLWYRRKTSATSWSTIYHLDNPAGSSDRRLNSPPAIAIDPFEPATVHILATRSGAISTRKKPTYSHALEVFSFPISNPSQGWFDIIEEKLGPLNPPLRTNPSIVRCETDNSFHAVWQREDTVSYAVKPDSDWWEIKGPPFGSDGAHSAHPFVETFGDSVFVVWQHLAPPNQHEEVYRASKYLTEDDFQWVNFSFTTNLASLHPVNASGSFTLYDEESTADSPHDIYYKIRSYDDRINVSNTANHSSYPQSVARFTLDNDFHYTVWLEGNAPPYEIKFKKMQHLDPEGKAYLSSINGMKTPSPYLVTRDSYIDDWRIPVDIGNTAATYKFPLVPGYSYKAKAVFYHESSGSWSAQVTIDNDQQSIVTCDANESKTLEFWIPPASYEDGSITMSFNRISGDYVAVGPIHIFRYEQNVISGGPMSQQIQPVRNALITALPNPFADRLNITCQIAEQNSADLKIYDVTGRLVKRFDLSSIAPSVNHITWDGIDDHGRKVPQGVYFIRVDNPATGDMLCHKVLRIK